MFLGVAAGLRHRYPRPLPPRKEPSGQKHPCAFSGAGACKFSARSSVLLGGSFALLSIGLDGLVRLGRSEGRKWWCRVEVGSRLLDGSIVVRGRGGGGGRGRW